MECLMSLPRHCDFLCSDIVPGAAWNSPTAQPGRVLLSPQAGLKETLPSPGSTRDEGEAAGWEQHPPARLALHSQELQHPQGLQLSLPHTNVKVCHSHTLASPWKMPQEVLIQRLSWKTSPCLLPLKPSLGFSRWEELWEGPAWEVLLDAKAGASLKPIPAQAPAQVVARDGVSPPRAIFARQDPKITQ